MKEFEQHITDAFPGPGSLRADITEFTVSNLPKFLYMEI